MRAGGLNVGSRVRVRQSAMPDGAAGFEPQKAAHSLGLAQSLLDAEDEAMAAELVAKYG